MKRIKRVLSLAFLWGIPIALVSILPWRDMIGERFGNPIALTPYILTILFWLCIAITGTTRNWWWSAGSAIAACTLVVLKAVT